MSPAVRVVIPTHERREHVTRLVDDLLSQTVSRDRIGIVAVCDGCSDGTPIHLRDRFGDSIEVLEQPASGPGAARNLGARAGFERLLLFIDDDMRARPDLVERHLEVHERVPGAIVLGAMPVDPSSPRSFLTVGLARWAARRDAALAAPGARPGFEEVLTGNISVPRAVFELLGGFDAAFTDGSSFGDEDLEFGWRAVQAGIPVIYAPGAVTAQVFDKSFRAVARDVRRGAVADFRFALKHPEARAHLALGREEERAVWERRAVRLGRSRPRLAASVAVPCVAILDVLARRGACGRRLEHAHAVMRALLYGLGLAEANSKVS